MNFKKMNLIPFFLLITALFVSHAFPVFAAEDAIASINVDAMLQSDGSAIVTETWDVRGISSGTEYYKALDNMKGMNVHSLLVSDESGKQYETLDGWDTKRSRDEKSGTCGILKTSRGYELCWGIGNYGDHQYTIQYTLEGLVKDYGDYAGFYHQFLSELSSAPGSASVKIRLADTQLTADNARIWAYGFTGETAIRNNGSLTAISTDALKKSEYVNILCRFDRNLFPSASAAGMSFEELQNSADNNKQKLVIIITLAIFLVFFLLTFFLITFFHSRYKLADQTIVRLPGKKQIDTNWSVPFGGSISAAYSTMILLRKHISYENLLGAYLIRWQEAGYIRMEMHDHKQGHKKVEKEEAIIFGTEKPSGSGAEFSLYSLLYGYADEKHLLRISDLEKQSKNITEKLTAWAENVKAEGNNELIQLNAASTDTKGTIRFTTSGFEQAIRMLGLQKYLLGMSSQSTDKASERSLWGDYLVFATLFHIGEEVLKSMKTLDPAHFNSFSGMYGCTPYSMIYLMTMTNHISSAAAPKVNTNGTGGVAGSVGGGGFSGGGGGGSR